MAFKLPPASNPLEVDDVVARLTESGIQAVFRRLGVEEFKSGGMGNWLVRSPFHEDRKRSFTIRRTDGVWSDKATGEGGTIFQAVMRKEEVDFRTALEIVAEVSGYLRPPQPAEPIPLAQARRKIDRIYDYHYEDGRLAYQVIRYLPKDFRQRRPDGQGGWLYELGDTERVLYRLPELVKAPAEDFVFVVEGEKDADRLAAAGLVATTCAQGANAWRAEYAETLRDRRVVVIPDNDETGQRHAARVVASLLGVASEVRLLNLPGLPAKGDASDWFDAGGTGFALEMLATEAPVIRPEDHTPGPVVVSLADVETRPIDWIWKKWLARGKVTILGGQGGHGKSTLAAWMAALLSHGGTWPDGSPAPQARTLFLLAEDALDDTLRPRLEAHEADLHQIHALTFIRETDQKTGETREIVFNLAKHLTMLEAAVVKFQIDVVIIDPLTSFMQNAKRNDEGEVRDILTPLTALADRLHVAIIGIMHVGKPNGTARSPVQQLLGSVAFANVARMVWMVAPTTKEPNSPRVLGVAKTNLAMEPKALEWTIAGRSGAVEWIGEAETTLDEALAAHSKQSPEREHIIEYLESQGTRSATAEQVAQALNKKISAVRWLLSDMAKTGIVVRVATGLYQAPQRDTNNTNNTHTTNFTNNANGSSP